MSGAVSSPIPSNWRVPLFYMRFSPTNANAGQVTQRTLLLGTCATGISAPMVPTPIQSPSYAAGTFGQASTLARATVDYFANDATGTLYALPLPNATGAVAATATITITGTVGSAGGVLSMYLGGDVITATVAAGATATSAAAALAAAINATPTACATATSSSGTITLTAAMPGSVGNQIDLRFNYYGAPNNEFTPPGLTLAVTAFSGGSLDPVLTGIDAITGDQNFDFIISPYTLTAQTTALSAMMNNVSGRWSATRLSMGHVFSHRDDTYANMLSLGGALNDPHLTVLGTYNSPTPPWRGAAMYAGAAAASLRNLASQPLQTLPLVGFLPPDGPSQLNKASINTLLNTGIAQASYAAGGTAAIVRAVTTYQLNQYGLPDQSYLDTETLFVLMAISRAMDSMFTSKYPRAILVPDGTPVGPGLPVITPAIALAEIAALYNQLQTQGLVDNAAAMLAGTSVTISTTDSSRLEVDWVPNLVSGLRIVDALNQFALLAPAA